MPQHPSGLGLQIGRKAPWLDIREYSSAVVWEKCSAKTARTLLTPCPHGQGILKDIFVRLTWF
jgi:hypothetical protein